MNDRQDRRAPAAGTAAWNEAAAGGRIVGRWFETPARRALWIAFGLLVAAVLFAYIGPGEVVGAFRTASVGYVGLGVLAYAAFFVLRGARWQMLLQEGAPGATVATTTSLTALGWLVSSFVPMKAGDVSRTVLLARRERAGVAAVAGTVVAERALDVLGLAVASSAGLLLLTLDGAHVLSPSMARALAVAWMVPPLGLLTLALMARRIPPERRRNRFLRVGGEFLDVIHALLRSPARLVGLVLLTVACTLSQASIFVFLFRAFEPAAPLLLVAAVAPLFLLSFVVAVTPGHVGTYEAAFVAVFALLGYDPEGLLATALAVHLLTLSTATFLGTIGFAVYRWEAASPDGRAPRPEAHA